MTESLCVAPGCSRPRPGHAFLCHGCVGKLERSLGDVPALWRELAVTLTRQDVIGTDGGRKSAETGLPFKPNASEARDVLANVVGTWARLIAEHAGISQPPARPARWLSLNVQSIAMHPAADEAFDEITDAVRQAYRAIDRVADLLLAGTCDLCERRLYARPTDGVTKCQGCGQQYSTVERRDVMVASAVDAEGTATEVRAWLAILTGHIIPNGTFRSWVSRGRLLRQKDDHVGRPLYRFGDVRVLAEDWAQRRTDDAA